ncbi:hypothetical protein CROQUDRAFT_54301 [Cronartium quercuum f. sp. fusiforme G11]|uniref:Autophagy-related protein n=1 Tax=Cronartium quercuum f. sp. fusiforme G11 TaxID=708437 RepID=A0A9P6T5U4_9BASI|nr:hypothetical protein CROQUDRAFT_54301 [Cronartium quercuum f. sp. fusiforme G11]
MKPSKTTSFKDISDELELEEEAEDGLSISVPMLPRADRNIQTITNHFGGPHYRHLWGFYCYSMASEIYSIAALSLFMPITLEQFARDNGYLFPLHQERCDVSSGSKKTQSSIPTICEVHLLGRWFDTSSFPLYVVSISVAIQAVLVCSLGDAADHLIFAAIGSVAGVSLLVFDSSSSLWPLIVISAIISNVSLGGSLVCLNSFIPSLSKNQPEVIRAQEALQLTDEPSDELEDKYHILLSNTISKLSAKGVSLGFGAGIIALIISLIPITIRNGDTNSLRWAIGASAIWWAIFTVPAAIWLPPSNWRTRMSFNEIFDPQKSWSQFSKMLQARNRLKHTFYYLMAWFLLSDAFSTITSTAIVFGKTSLNMPSSHLILIGIITPATGILGALLAPIVQDKIPYCTGINGGLKMFKLIIGATLSTEWEMYLLAGLFGTLSHILLNNLYQYESLNNIGEAHFFFFFEISGMTLFSKGTLYGAFQSYARSLFAELIPPMQEAKWYALFSITDKSSSFFGPFIVGLIADYTHNIRFGFLFILIILLGSIPLLGLVEMNTGKVEAELYGHETN